MIEIFFLVIGLWTIIHIDRENKRKAARQRAGAGLLTAAFIADEFDTPDWSMNIDPSQPNDDYGVFSQNYYDPYLDPAGYGPNN